MKPTVNHKLFLFFIFLIIGSVNTSCLRYSFTGTSIPKDVNTVYIPFFVDQSGSAVGGLSDILNQELVDRFINQSRLSLANSQDNADAFMEGTIRSYSNKAFSINSDEEASLNQVSITVQATFQFANDEKPLWQKSFSGTAEYDPSEDPIEGEQTAVQEALQRIAENMFNDALGNW